MIKIVIYSSILSYFTAFFSFLITMIIAKKIEIEIFGIITYGLAIGAFIQILLNFASDKIFIKEVIHKNLNPFAYSTVQFLFQSLLFIITLLIYSSFDDNKLLFYVIIWFAIIGISPKSLYDFKEEIFKNTLLHFFERLLSLTFVLYFIFINKEIINSSVLIELFKYLILLRFFFTMLQIILAYEKCSRVEYTLSFLSFFENIKKRIYLVIALLSNSILLYGLQIITKIKLDYKSIAIYGLSVQLTLIVIIVQGQLIRHLNKKIFTQTKDSTLDIKTFNNTLKFSIYLTLPLSMLMIFCSFILENYYLNSEYKGLSNISIILAVWLNILGVGTIISQYFISLLGEKLYLYINLSGGIIAIILALSFFDIFQIYAGPLVLLIVHSTIIIIYYYILKRNTNVK